MEESKFCLSLTHGALSIKGQNKVKLTKISNIYNEKILNSAKLSKRECFKTWGESGDDAETLTN